MSYEFLNVQIYLIAELAVMDKPLPIESFEKVDIDGNPDGHYSLNELNTSPSIDIRKSLDGTEFVAGLCLKYIEKEVDAIEIALGDTLAYAFLGWEECDTIMQEPEWTDGTI